MRTDRIVVAGGSLGGLRAAEQLRARGFTGPITVVGAEPYLPYNRPPLSKDLLADRTPLTAAGLHARLAFRRRPAVADVDFRLGVAAASITAESVRLSDGTCLPYDGLVVATGTRARALNVPGPREGRTALRTIADCLRLRARDLTQDVVVVGGGFIGCEAAATLAALGAKVTVIEAGPAPLANVLGPDLARAVQRHHEAAGIRFITGRTVHSCEGTTRVGGVRLDDRTVVAAGLVVEAVGSVANTEWLGGLGTDVSDGVLCDNALRVAGAERAVAVGDVARFPNPLFDGVARRVEHWSMPGDTARRAARTLCALLGGEPVDDEPFTPLPSFWSDQGGLRLNSFGLPALADHTEVVEGDPGDLPGGVVALCRRGGEHVGTVAVNVPPVRLRELREAFLLKAEVTCPT